MDVSIGKKWVAVVASVFALCLALAGCAGGSGGTGGADPSKNYVGDWKLVGMEENGEATSADDIKLMESMGMTVALSVKEDKSFSLSVFGEELPGTWEAKSDSEATFTVDGQSIPATLANEVLTMEQDGTKMMFEKGTVSASSSGAAASGGDAGGSSGAAAAVGSGATDEAAIPIGQTIADDDVCTIEVVNKTADWAGDPGFTLKITNKSDKVIDVTGKYGTFSVDGRMMDPALFETVQPGKYVECFMWFSDGIESVDELVNVEGTIEVYDEATYDTLAEYPFAM
ncbi:MAG: hypothetical protein PUE38_08760 [Olsenella sp.]|nr:hypothetical protein [Olsenella sp.]